jgi:hypothetical protein
MTSLAPTGLTPTGPAPTGRAHTGPMSTGLPPLSAAAGTLVAAIGLQLALLAPTLIAFAVDERLLNDIPIWIKPIKFQLSLCVLLATLLMLLPLIPPDRRDGRTVRWTVSAVVVAATLEVLYIVLQAARGVGSHYNVGTPLEAAGYTLMGAGATIMVAGCFVIGVVILRAPDRHGEGLRVGAGVGLCLGAVLTLVTAFVLASGYDGPGHWVGGVRSDVGGLPLVGWSTTGGDLRVPHFFATHLMQAIPVVGWLADRYRPSAARSAVALSALLGTGVVAWTFLQAIGGRPFIG